ncbi:MAG: hypothetical protein HRU70_14550 [Phycisphaeraceae bacterium]|nr:MAG: hypothetical protein HRU70_14550 [Phycisphaeraceae bacterium]
MTNAGATMQAQDHTKARALVDELLAEFLGKNAHARDLSERLAERTGTRLADWVDSIEVPLTARERARFGAAGFAHRPAPGSPEHHAREGAGLPSLILGNSMTVRVGVRVDSVADFLAAWRLEHPVDGEPFSQFRASLAFHGQYADLHVVERHGYRGFTPVYNSEHQRLMSVRHAETFRRRHRDFGVDDAAESRGVEHTLRMVESAVHDLGRDWACDLFFAAEREYWQRRCRAGLAQKAAQDTLGLGWGNHHRHVYRASERTGVGLSALLGKLGFKETEGGSAGAPASRTFEQPVAGIVVDVEAADGPAGEVARWCALHGESLLQGGLRGLVCRAGITGHGGPGVEPCPIEPKRLEAAVSRGVLKEAEAARLRAEGAEGSIVVRAGVRGAV